MLTTAALLSTVAQLFDTRTQKLEVAVIAPVVSVALFVPTGDVATPAAPANHWYVSGASPVATTVSVADDPLRTLVDAGCVVIDGGRQAEVTVTIAALLFTRPQLLVMRTQKLVLDVSAGVVYVSEFVPTGRDVSPAFPRNHSNRRLDPVASTCSVAVPPAGVVAFAGCVVIAGATHAGATVISAVVLFAVPQLFVAWTQ